MDVPGFGGVMLKFCPENGDGITGTRAMPTQNASDSSLMRISQAAKSAEVSKQTIEYYILIGLIEPIRQGPHRRRFFDQNLVKRIRLIRRMNRSGYTLRDIREIYSDRL